MMYVNANLTHAMGNMVAKGGKQHSQRRIVSTSSLPLQRTLR
jgi:hypothetical protein